MKEGFIVINEKISFSKKDVVLWFAQQVRTRTVCIFGEDTSWIFIIAVKTI